MYFVLLTHIIKNFLILIMLLFANTILAYVGIESGFVNVNSVDIYYEIEGKGQQILLIHCRLEADHWAFIIDSLYLLADIHKLVYYDHRCNGQSTGSDETFTYENLVKDAEALRQFIKLDKIVI